MSCEWELRIAWCTAPNSWAAKWFPFVAKKKKKEGKQLENNQIYGLSEHL